MHVDDATIRRAFDAYVHRYVRGTRKAWPVPDKIGLYLHARDAFSGEGGQASFQHVYRALKGPWQAFRNSASCWSVERTFSELRQLPGDVRGHRLSDLGEAHWRGVWNCIQRVRDVKTVTSGVTSLVAISKVLHFWNPRIFVICDRQVVEEWALGHKWLSDQLPPEHAVTGVLGPGAANDRRLLFYMRVLLFARDLVRANPAIPRTFADIVNENRGHAQPPEDVNTYEATAVEWFLLGLVELPPSGVSLQLPLRGEAR